MVGYTTHMGARKEWRCVGLQASPKTRKHTNLPQTYSIAPNQGHQMWSTMRGSMGISQIANPGSRRAGQLSNWMPDSQLDTVREGHRVWTLDYSQATSITPVLHSECMAFTYKVKFWRHVTSIDKLRITGCLLITSPNKCWWRPVIELK